MEAVRVGLGVVGGLALAVLLPACRREEPARPDPVGAETDSVLPVASVPSTLEGLYAADVDFDGCWSWSWLGGFDNTALCATRAAEGSFELDFCRCTDFGPPFDHATRATGSGAGLALETVDQRISASVLYPARFEGVDCLVPDTSLPHLEKGEKLWGNPDGTEFAFRRAADGLVEENREGLKRFWESRAKETVGGE